MKKTLLLILSPLLLCVGFFINKPINKAVQLTTNHTMLAELPDTLQNRHALQLQHKKEEKVTQHIKRKEIVTYAMSLMGSPYVYAGISPDGFDCSGFTTHVFDNHNIKIPHSSAMQAEIGDPVQRQKAKPGDLVIFTGTNPEIRQPGHVGIVISEPGDTISFVHSSSNGGVKVSKVKGTGYDRRFIGVRRVL